MINRDVVCSCERTHHCTIKYLQIERGALNALPQAVSDYSHILVVADNNTYPLCGDRVCNLLGEKLDGICTFYSEDFLVPNEESIAKVESFMNEHTDLILGIGSGVINDLCKYVAYMHNIPSGIIASAPSMDGYASPGAAMILRGMKVTVTANAPALIIGDVDILRAAPMEMIRAGYGDIIGKYSALCDWKLSALINGEYFCHYVYDTVLQKTNEIRSLAKALTNRDTETIKLLIHIHLQSLFF